MSADDVSWWANWILVGALMVGVAATYAIVVSGNIKEANLKRELKEKDDALETYKLTVDGKVADAKREGIEAGKTAGDALVRAAGLEKEAATARLETEKLKQVVAWRTLSPDVRAKLDKVLASKPASVNLRYMDGDPEAMYLGVQMTEVLTEFRSGASVDLRGAVTRDGLSLAELGHLRAIEFQLDQCWDLLDQLEARLGTRPNGLGSVEPSRGRTT